MPGLSTIAAAIVIAIVVVMAVSAVRTWRHPLAALARKERRRLARLGLKKSVLDAPVGKIVFWEGGSGPTLVFLHGAGDQAGTWSQVMQQLGQGHRVLLIDQAGHGDSEPREGPLSIGMVLASVESVLADRVPDERVVLIGNSMGAWVSMLYAHLHPERVALVVPVNGGPLSGIRTDVSLMPANREEARRLLRLSRGPASAARVPGFVLDDIVRQARNGPIGRLSQTAAEMPQYILDDQLKDFKVPVEIVWGEADEFLGLTYAKRLEAGVPGGHLTLLADCGHIPQRECPALFAAKVGRLLKARAQSASASAGPTH